MRVGAGHCGGDFPGEDGAAVAVEHGAEEVEGAADVDVGEVGVPVLVGGEWLDEAGSFFGLGSSTTEEAFCREDPVDGGRAEGGDVFVDHFVGEGAVSFVELGAGVADDGLFFGGRGVVAAREVCVVLVGFAEPGAPVVVGVAPQGCPGDESFTGDGGAFVERFEEDDDTVAGVGLDPLAFHDPPSGFFASTSSCASSPMTATLRLSSPSSWAILASLGSCARFFGEKAAAPPSKKSFCQV